MNRRPIYDDILPVFESASEKRERLITVDISKIEAVLQSSKKEELIAVHREIDGKYQSCIKNWHQGILGVISGFGVSYEDLNEADLRENLQSMKPKLEAFKNGWNVMPVTEASHSSDVSVTVNNQVQLNITFEQVRSQIEDMTSLTDKETTEIMEKIAELEEIINSKDKKKNKWEKAKSVLVWLADKSFDVGMAMLPLLLKIQS